MKAIVSRLQAIEEMAGIDILCSDKTGTLTLNQLTLGDPVTFGLADPQEVIMVACLASRAENRDAIDDAVMDGLKDKSPLQACSFMKFIPFDPVHKRTEATVKDGDKTFKVTKGAPQVVMELCHLEGDIQTKAQAAVDELAAKGYRTLGVARADDGDDWRFLGILPLYDPPGWMPPQPLPSSGPWHQGEDRHRRQRGHWPGDRPAAGPRHQHPARLRALS
jgi:H+-transporting ATPase